MNTAFLDNYEIKVPGTWEELEPSQTLRLVPLLQARKPAKEHRLRALLILLPVKNNIRLLKKLNRFNLDEWAELFVLTNFIWENKASFTKQKFPRVGNLFGPGDGFKHLVFYEFIKAEQHYLEFSKKQEVALLDKMIATLWRPADPLKAVGDVRERYTDDTVAMRFKQVSKWPLEQKLAVYLWFDSCRQQLVTLFPAVFPKAPRSGTFNPAARPKTWIDVATSMAENVTNVEQVLYSDLFILMLFLNNKIEEAEEFERQNKKK